MKNVYPEATRRVTLKFLTTTHKLTKTVTYITDSVILYKKKIENQSGRPDYSSNRYNKPFKWFP